MIRNGLHHSTTEMLARIEGGNQGVMVVRDGTMRGGGSFFHACGTAEGDGVALAGKPSIRFRSKPRLLVGD